MSSVSDSPITAIFQEHHVYTVEKSMVAVVFRFLVSPNSFLPFNVFFLVSHFYQCSTLLYHKLVDIPGFGDIPSDISQLPFSSGHVQFSFFQDSRFNIIVLLQVFRCARQNHKSRAKQSNVVASNSSQIGTTRLWVEYNAGFTHSCGIQILYAVVLFRFSCNINIQ